MKRLAIVVLLSALMVTPCYGSTANCHELVMSYVVHDQDPPQKAGDYLFHEDGTSHKLVETTGYFQGKYGSHGDKVRVGHVAYVPELYGYCMEAYKAIETDEGYKLGEFIGLYEIRDCGYGRKVKKTDKAEQIKSRVTSKPIQGTIEAGLSADFRFDNLAECKEWMKETGGMIFIRIIPAKG